MTTVYREGVGVELKPMGPKWVVGIDGLERQPFLVYIRRPRMGGYADSPRDDSPRDGHVWRNGPRAHFTACSDAKRQARLWVISYDEAEEEGFPIHMDRGVGVEKHLVWLMPCRNCVREAGFRVDHRATAAGEAGSAPAWLRVARRWAEGQILIGDGR